MQRGSTTRWAGVAAVLLLSGCALEDERWQVSGVVREIYESERSIKIDHGDIDGLMPAMTMSFDVAPGVDLEAVEPGVYVEFELVRSDDRFEIVDLTTPEGGSSGVGGGSSAPADPLASAEDLAPAFDLIDQDGRGVSLASLRGAPVVLDFVFTRCAGPCPILTGLLADAREALEPEQRERVRFVSISLDPEFDTPEILRGYAKARRIDTRGWSFLTGERAAVDRVVRAYGVGNTPAADGSEQLEHTVATFLIDARGRIAKRYLGVAHRPEDIRDALVELL